MNKESIVKVFESVTGVALNISTKKTLLKELDKLEEKELEIEQNKSKVGNAAKKDSVGNSSTTQGPEQR